MMKTASSFKIHDQIADDPNKDKRDPNSDYYAYYTETFNYTKNTMIKTFQQTVCKFWNVQEDEFYFYDDNGELLRDINFLKKMDKLVDYVKQRELRDKDLFDGPRLQMLYLGDKDFDIDYNRHIQLLRRT